MEDALLISQRAEKTSSPVPLEMFGVGCAYVPKEARHGVRISSVPMKAVRCAHVYLLCVCVCVCFPADANKTMLEKLEEEAMIKELVELVEKRNQLVLELEEERLKCVERESVCAADFDKMGVDGIV